MYTQSTGHATEEVSQSFTEAHKPQRGAQRMSARVFERICRFLKTTRIFYRTAGGKRDASPCAQAAAMQGHPHTAKPLLTPAPGTGPG